jgi:hypothetical protein
LSTYLHIVCDPGTVLGAEDRERNQTGFVLACLSSHCTQEGWTTSKIPSSVSAPKKMRWGEALARDPMGRGSTI